jgi:hypothetical protein
LLPRIDYAVEDTTGLSQLVTTGAFQNATGFKGRVMVVTGGSDHIVCSGNCADGTWVQDALDFFPYANQKDYLIVPNTGHDVNMHYSNQYPFYEIHKWLAQGLASV